MIGLIFIICLLFFLIIYLIVLSIVERERILLFPIIGTTIILFSFCSSIRSSIKNEGIICDIEKVQTSYELLITDGIINPVPVYSYIVLFKTEKGEYRIFFTEDMNYEKLKEGDKITYTIDETEKIKEN
jgi:hypothetical protein